MLIHQLMEGVCCCQCIIHNAWAELLDCINGMPRTEKTCCTTNAAAQPALAAPALCTMGYIERQNSFEIWLSAVSQVTGILSFAGFKVCPVSLVVSSGCKLNHGCDDESRVA